jgi:anaerobic ribonucleoside-triphosphate reductase
MSDHICPTCHKPMPNTCPICNKPADLYSRIVGYLRPIHTWNPGKRQEFIERKTYTLFHGDHIDGE